MTTDTSREAVEALIAEHKQLWAKGAFINASLARQIEQTLAALLDERDAQFMLLNAQARSSSEYQQRIHELENAAFGADGSLSMNMAVASIRAAESKASDRLRGQLQTVEVERDKLAAKLDAVTAQRFHEAYERLAPEFGYRTREASAVPWADVPEQNKRLMEATVAAILADTDEPKGDEQ